ncbi:MAG: LamG-like jellyroll fold domain-containing protein, partial [Chitinophagaceae bacterium]
MYEAANGGNYLKPFDVDELFDHAVDGGTPVRVVSPGNQFTMNKWFPSQMIGSGTRPRNPYNIMQSAYDMEALTSGTIANWFTQNRCTLSVNTSTAFTGAQSLGVVTNSANGNPVELYFTIGTATMWTPIQPLQRYRIGFAINNTGAGSAVFQLRYKHDININSEAAQVGTTTKLAGGGWTHYTVDWTAPAGIYGAFFLLRFNAAGYTLAIDDITIECLEVEPDIGDNLMPYWGDFETLDTLSMKLESISGSGSDYSIIDDASIAASGRRFGSLLKPSGTGAVNLVLGSYYGHAHSYTDGGTSGRAYKLKFKARTSVSITGTVAPLYKHNDTAHNGAFGNLTAKNLSTSWTEYEYDIVVPAGLTSTLLGFTFTGTSGTTASMYFDDVRLEKFPSGINEALSTVGPGLERTTIYDAELTLGHVFYMYGNDEIHDARYVRQTYHSGKTRTRFKMTMTSAGHDFGGTADLYWVEVLGHTRRNAIGNDFPDYYASRLLYDSPITLPTSGSPTTINVLAPDIPDVAYVPMIIFYDSNGPQTFGYTFTDEYIGPDGYEDDPEVLERVWFRGLVEQRRDTFASMGIDDKRVLKVDLDCVDLMGTLQSVELDTPYNSVVFRDKPMAYFTFNDDPTREIGELAGRTEVRASIATIGPASDDYGVKAASDVELLAGSEGGSYKISPEDGTFNGGSVIFKERTWSEAVINGGAFECWFRSGIPSGDWDSPKILATQYMASNASVECGISIWLNENDVYFGWGYGTQFGSYAGYNTTLYDGQSHHILVTHDASILYLYIDGILRSTYDQIAPELPHDTTSIGGWNGEGINSTMNGWVSHVAFYDRYLSASEAETHYLVGKFAGLGDDEVARLNYILDVARVSGVPSTVKDRDGNRPASATTLDYMNWSSGASPVSELKACAFTDAGGLIYAQGNDIVYEPRQTRWNRGMHVASWEVGSELIEPQLPISSNPDVSKIVNEITITRQSDADLKVVNVLS